MPAPARDQASAMDKRELHQRVRLCDAATADQRRKIALAEREIGRTPPPFVLN
jgi:hypothetical protein